MFLFFIFLDFPFFYIFHAYIFPQHFVVGSPFLPSLSVSWLIAGIELFRPPPCHQAAVIVVRWCCTLNKLLCRRSLFPETPPRHTTIFFGPKPPQRYTTIFFGIKPPQRYATIFLTMYTICTKYQ